MDERAITFTANLDSVDWATLKVTLQQDAFDNGRTPDQLRQSFVNSHTVCLAYSGDRIIGTARALSDGVCNAYIVDVWTLSDYRRQGVARKMLENLLDDLQGQHVYLFTDQAQDFYTQLGFKKQGTGMGKVVGEWLKNVQS